MRPFSIHLMAVGMLPLGLVASGSPILVGCDDGAADKGTDTAAAAIATNQAPIAVAGSNIRQSADTSVQLSGTATDADGDAPLTFHWTFDRVPDGSEVATRESPFSKNNSADATSPTFMPDRVGTYIVSLTVNDGKVDSASDSVIVTITEPENLPVANAGADMTIAQGETATLSGVGSFDPQGRVLTYAWTLVDKPAASAVTTLSGAETSAATFVPDARGIYTANLVVNNGLAASVGDAVVVTVTGTDGAPVANAGEDQLVEDCTSVTLDCGASVDPDGDALTYQWAIQSKPAGSSATFGDASAQSTAFWADQAGSYVLSCAVSDGANWSTPDTLTLAASERASNSEPVVSAGADLTVSGGTGACEASGYTYNCEECSAVSVSLGSDASISDPDRDPFTIEWTVLEGSASIADPTSVQTTAILSDAEPTEPGECEDVEYKFQLRSVDCTGAETKDSITFTVTCCGVTDSAP